MKTLTLDEMNEQFEDASTRGRPTRFDGIFETLKENQVVAVPTSDCDEPAEDAVSPTSVYNFLRKHENVRYKWIWQGNSKFIALTLDKRIAGFATYEYSPRDEGESSE